MIARQYNLKLLYGIYQPKNGKRPVRPRFSIPTDKKSRQDASATKPSRRSGGWRVNRQKAARWMANGLLRFRIVAQNKKVRTCPRPLKGRRSKARARRSDAGKRPTARDDERCD